MKWIASRGSQIAACVCAVPTKYRIATATFPLPLLRMIFSEL